ncbi:SusE domain-containing protein [Arcticibacter tournemirensis]
MKKLQVSIIMVVLLAFFGCKDDYQLSTDFTVPSDLSSPKKVILDVTSSSPIMFSWSGGGAADGSYVLYDIVFDKKGGDFSNPIQKLPGDNGALTKLTLSHDQLNSIARKAGIKPGETGTLSWTVLTSKGGDVKKAEVSSDIELTRGEGIDNMPDKLYLHGSGNESSGASGLPFRKASEGIYVIYSKVSGSGDLELKGTLGQDEFSYYLDGTKLKEGPGVIKLAPNANPYRITVNFNTLSVKTEVISGVRCIWGATFGTIGNLAYIGSGKFEARNCAIKFIDPSRPDTNPPGWLGWTEERYYFIANIDGSDKCWGRMDGVSAERPSGNEPLSFYQLGEFSWSQWDHLWKMSGDLDLKRATITIDTNKDNLMVHQFSNITTL